MKLAISTLVCKDWTLEETIAVCCTCGIDALELRMGIHDWSKENLPDHHYAQMQKQLEREGLCVSDLATGVVVDADSKESLQQIERCAQIARILGCKGLRIMLGHFRTRWSEKIEAPDHAGIVRWLQAAEPIMAQYDTEIWIETHNEYSSGASLADLVNEAALNRCHFIWDIMHPLEVGEQPADTIAHMKQHLVHVHIKDGKPWPDKDLASFCYTALGDGELPIQQIIRQLNEIHFAGYYSLEWEAIWREELREKNYDCKSIVKEYATYMKAIPSYQF